MDVQIHRIRVCDAFLHEGIRFNVLSDPQGKLRKLLEYGRGTLPIGEVTQHIPQLRKAEKEKVEVNDEV